MVMERICFSRCTRIAVCVLVCGLICITVGCMGMSVAKAGFREVTGAESILTEIQKPLPSKLAKYKYIAVERFSNMMASKLPSRAITSI